MGGLSSGVTGRIMVDTMMKPTGAEVCLLPVLSVPADKVPHFADCMAEADPPPRRIGSEGLEVSNERGSGMTRQRKSRVKHPTFTRLSLKRNPADLRRISNERL